MIVSLETQYSVLSAEITSYIGRLSVAEINDRRDLIAEINKGLDEASELLEQILLEINQNPNMENRKSQQTRLNSYKAELKRLVKEYNQSKIRPSSFEIDESSLEDFEGGIEDQKRSLLDNSERLERTGNQLQDAYRIAIETEEVGSVILSNLHKQRENIQISRSRLRETDADLGRGNRIMNLMLVRSIRDRFAIYAIGVVFVVAIVLAVYFSMK